jgi:cell division cycle 2-like protein
MSKSPSPDASASSHQSQKRSRWTEHEGDDSAGPSTSNPIPSIKRRLVRPRKIRRPEDGLEDDKDHSESQQEHQPDSPIRINIRFTFAPVAEVPAAPKNSTSPPPLLSPPRARRPLPRSHYTPHRKDHPPLQPSSSVYSYTRLNHIEEGTYGIVFRARCNTTGGIYALKKLKLEEEKGGFPITSLREVMALMRCGGHENVVGVREVVVGETLNQ